MPPGPGYAGVPFRGAYLRLRPGRDSLVRASIYPVPDPELPFLGMHLTRTVAGEVLLGPTALLVGARDAYRLRRVLPRDLLESVAWPGTRRMMRRFWRSGLVELRHAVSIRSFVAECRRYVPELRPRRRAQPSAGVAPTLSAVTARSWRLRLSEIERAITSPRPSLRRPSSLARRADCRRCRARLSLSRP